MLPCCKPQRAIENLNEMMGRKPADAEGLTDICKLVSDFLREGMREKESDLAQRLSADLLKITDDKKAMMARIICREIPYAVAQLNPCMIVQFLLQLIGLIGGRQAADNVSKAVGVQFDEALRLVANREHKTQGIDQIDDRVFEVLLQLIMLLLGKGGAGEGGGGESSWNPSTEERC